MSLAGIGFTGPNEFGSSTNTRDSDSYGSWHKTAVWLPILILASRKKKGAKSGNGMQG